MSDGHKRTAPFLFLRRFFLSNCAKENWLNGIIFRLISFAFLYSPPTVPCDILTHGIDHQYKHVFKFFISVENSVSANSLLHSVSDKIIYWKVDLYQQYSPPIKRRVTKQLFNVGGLSDIEVL